MLHLVSLAVYAFALRSVFDSYHRTRELWLGVGLQDLVLVVLVPTAIVCLVGVLGAKRKAFLTAAVGHGFLAMQCLAIPIALWLAISCGIGLTARTPGQGYPGGLQTLLIVMMLCEVVRGSRSHASFGKCCGGSCWSASGLRLTVSVLVLPSLAAGIGVGRRLCSRGLGDLCNLPNVRAEPPLDCSGCGGPEGWVRGSPAPRLVPAYTPPLLPSPPSRLCPCAFARALPESEPSDMPNGRNLLLPAGPLSQTWTPTQDPPRSAGSPTRQTPQA